MWLKVGVNITRTGKFSNRPLHIIKTFCFACRGWFAQNDILNSMLSSQSQQNGQNRIKDPEEGFFEHFHRPVERAKLY